MKERQKKIQKKDQSNIYTITQMKYHTGYQKQQTYLDKHAQERTMMKNTKRNEIFLVPRQNFIYILFRAKI